MPTALGSLKLTDQVLLDGEGSGLTDTDDLDEGATNLYYTDARARAAISVQPNVGLTYAAGVVGHNQDLRTTGTPTFGGLTLGSLGGVLKAASGVVSGSATTTDLTEGSNLYYTDARVTAYLGALTGTDDTTTFLRGDKAWSNALTGSLQSGGSVELTGTGARAFGRVGTGLALADSLVLRGAANEVSDTDGGAYIKLFPDTGVVAEGNGRIDIDAYGRGTAAAANAIRFRTRSGAGTIQERMRIFSSGGVAIGNFTDPGAASFYVSGGINVGTGSGAASGEIRLSAGIGFYGTAATTKQAVTGSRGANAALASLLTALAAYGLITDSSSA